jgi:hypothetical protein
LLGAEPGDFVMSFGVVPGVQGQCCEYFVDPRGIVFLQDIVGERAAGSVTGVIPCGTATMDSTSKDRIVFFMV